MLTLKTKKFLSIIEQSMKKLTHWYQKSEPSIFLLSSSSQIYFKNRIIIASLLKISIMKISVLLICILFGFNLKSQSIQGRLIDKQGEALPYATVQLLDQDSSLLKVEASRVDGSFEFKDLKTIAS